MLSNLSQYSQFPGLQAGGFPQMSQGFGLYLLVIAYYLMQAASSATVHTTMTACAQHDSWDGRPVSSRYPVRIRFDLMN